MKVSNISLVKLMLSLYCFTLQEICKVEVRDFVHQQQAKHWMQGAVIHPTAQDTDTDGAGAVDVDAGVGVSAGAAGGASSSGVK